MVAAIKNKFTRARKVERIIIHHSAGNLNDTVGDIRRFHVEKRGFSDIGYHALIDANGNVWAGRRISIAGAHTRGHNTETLGLCFIGYYHAPTNHALTAEQLDGAAKHLAYWCNLFGLATDKIFPHSWFARTACPGDGVREHMGELRLLTQKHLVAFRDNPAAALRYETKGDPKILEV